MKTRTKRLFAILCGMAILCGSVGLGAKAEEAVEVQVVDEYREPAGENVGHGVNDISGNPSARAATLTNCRAGISVSANGVRGVIKTGSTVTASEIGIKNIRVEKYVNGRWTLVGSHPGGYTTNDDAYVVDVWTDSAEKGVQYRITCTHYAILDGVRRELNNATDGVSY